MTARGRPRAFDRDEVLDKAMRLFWERGYEAVALADITAVTGINSPSLYAAYGAKEELFRAAVRRYNEQGSPVQNALATQPTARLTIEVMLRDSARTYTDPANPRGCMVVLAATNCTQDNAAIQDFLADCRRTDRDQLRDRLARGVTEGELPKGTDPTALADFFHTVLYGLSIRARDGASTAELLAIVDTALAAWPPETG
ncbi:TetR family transcriptional regulator [Tamaricihabitans halophyticus]|uniref:TetR family transcriptional regulator n=1 Tax=Tamaricihabitans halophyticus TaxID=1262583 RepID=A0A4R2QKQ5_9PSEU|nr:TetR/AcrR family transcriptional regulator [Tamaricihabitans halophyticus]TCP49354.1 TetR family transcriptional regulator [Tamaricihabitans halophyticus]